MAGGNWTIGVGLSVKYAGYIMAGSSWPSSMVLGYSEIGKVMSEATYGIF